MIRPYQPSDKETLVEIFKLNTPTYFDPKEVNDFINYIEHQQDTYLTIEREGKIVGGTGYSINNQKQSGAITWIFFHPDYSGMGLGKQAVEHCLNILKQKPSVKKLVVTTSQFAYQFFGKFGFELIHTKKDFWGPGLDLYEMEMSL